MKKILIALMVLGILYSCKGDKPSRPALGEKAATVNPAVRDGNVIRQKVTVGGNQTKNINIKADEALSMMKENPNIKILDVRTPSEVADGIYSNALHIDFNGADFKTKINKLDKNDTYIVYCKSGGRSGKAVNMMRAFGFEKSYNMQDGYEAMAKL